MRGVALLRTPVRHLLVLPPQLRHPPGLVHHLCRTRYLLNDSSFYIALEGGSRVLCPAPSTLPATFGLAAVDGALAVEVSSPASALCPLLCAGLHHYLAPLPEKGLVKTGLLRHSLHSSSWPRGCGRCSMSAVLVRRPPCIQASAVAFTPAHPAAPGAGPHPRVVCRAAGARASSCPRPAPAGQRGVVIGGLLEDTHARACVLMQRAGLRPSSAGRAIVVSAALLRLLSGAPGTGPC